MPFSQKQKADYVEMINELLDKIRITSATDFDDAIADLQKIVDFDNVSPIDFHPNLKDSMNFILDCLFNPEMYVQSRTDDAEYQQLIKDRIKAKIKEFSEFTPEQKIQYMENQQHLREQAAIHQEVMAAAEPRRAVDVERIQAEREAFVAEQRRIEEQIQRQRSNAVTNRLNEEELQRLPGVVNSTTYHIIGDLYFRIEEARNPSHFDSNTHTFSTLINDREITENGMHLSRHHVLLIVRNINNVQELKRIFTEEIQGWSASQILSTIIDAERRAGSTAFASGAGVGEEQQQQTIPPIIQPMTGLALIMQQLFAGAGEQLTQRLFERMFAPHLSVDEVSRPAVLDNSLQQGPSPGLRRGLDQFRDRFSEAARAEPISDLRPPSHVAAAGLFVEQANAPARQYDAAMVERMRNGIPIIGGLSFKIVELQRPFVGGETHTLSTVFNNNEENHIMLRREHIDLIMNNINNVGELKRIFTDVIQSVTANGILNAIIDAERRAEQVRRI